MLQDRFKKLGAKIAENPWEEKQIYYLSRIGRQVDDGYIKELLDECKKHDIKLIIFDSLVRFHTARENDSVEMAKILDCEEEAWKNENIKTFAEKVEKMLSEIKAQI